MLTEFLQAAKGSIVWLVIPNAVVKGKLLTHKTDIDKQISLVILRNVSILQAGAETDVDELIVPTFHVSAWGTDNQTFDHLSPRLSL